MEVCKFSVQSQYSRALAPGLRIEPTWLPGEARQSKKAEVRSWLLCVVCTSEAGASSGICGLALSFSGTSWNITSSQRLS